MCMGRGGISMTSLVKSLTRCALGAILLGLVLCGPASAVLITIDEDGHGTVDGTPLPFFKGPDIGPGGLLSTLHYGPSLFLIGTVPGDVHLTEGAGSAAVFLDVIRFNGDGTVIFYSDNLDGFDSLADTAAPPSIAYPNLVSIPEIGPEGDNGAFYTPGPGNPGFSPEFALTYHFVSDGEATADEPSPAALMLLGLGMLGFGFKRRALGMR